LSSIDLKQIKAKISMIEFHVKSIQSDIDGRHFDNWNGEASQIWKEIFREISAMEDSERTEALELIREQWMDYLKHFASI
tara:strand:- start:24799 stop:25038 length:240 start_codon:yes stop_codon:yes gene_type:complete